ncbi:hypothetical protein PMIT1306_00268 [Prochlorococcus sp. MIT 1306]|nr:hypothetical protein PMIT1306_00268 [Prochlorococcus sp. MIT 1306]
MLFYVFMLMPLRIVETVFLDNDESLIHCIADIHSIDVKK